ncbi:hypothetical protein TRFO_19294 [Tritrichomonas foetus]|uniref:Uncharacterized protein n=1 Tax=Tritrichomonas foetus TaxID=1144522 RepID=A0A1J4KK36_9EUKA|nr:hypothetical protein TRFO_19294 [Tritrichomonas foetus]|eukprot:OHT11312.1 hypothetical protein TRFO_19294 [Tritrichomonas foetus]
MKLISETVNIGNNSISHFFISFYILMTTLNIKIIELITEEKYTSMNPLQVFINTSSKNDRGNTSYNSKITKLKICKSSAGNVLKCDKSIQYEIVTQRNSFINVELKRHRVIIADDSLGNVLLPLEWFPTNHVVREWFPIHNKNTNKDSMILLDVHVDRRKVMPFMAPFATLRVLPCWQRPTLTEHNDFPVIPPIVYIIQSYNSQTISPNAHQIQDANVPASLQRIIPNHNTESNNSQQSVAIPQYHEYYVPQPFENNGINLVSPYSLPISQNDIPEENAEPNHDKENNHHIQSECPTVYYPPLDNASESFTLPSYPSISENEVVHPFTPTIY